MKSHNVAMSNLMKLYWPLLKANWQYLSLAVFLNIYYVPPMVSGIFPHYLLFLKAVYDAPIFHLVFLSFSSAPSQWVWFRLYGLFTSHTNVAASKKNKKLPPKPSEFHKIVAFLRAYLEWVNAYVQRWIGHKL